jgi:nucleotide-binding universal stress UspA family protein
MSTDADPPTAASPGAGTAPEGPAFASILCGIDASRISHEVTRQAAALAAGGGALELVAVTWTTGAGPSEMTALGATRAQAALEDAWHEAAGAGVTASWRIVTGEHASEALLADARGHDLLAVGAHSGSRAGGIFFGSTASAAVHRAEVPVLVVRPAPDGGVFPSKILVATDGSTGAGQAVDTAVRIASLHGSKVAVIHVNGGAGAEEHRAIAAHRARVFEAVGREPQLIEADGDAHEHIVAAARNEGCSLVVVGSRGLGGVRALGSVSERVAHEAVCSVLVARPGSERHS